MHWQCQFCRSIVYRCSIEEFWGCCRKKIVESVWVCSALDLVPAGRLVGSAFWGWGGVRCGHRPRLDSKLVFVLPFTLPTPAVTQRDNREEGGCSLNGKNKLKSPLSHSPPPQDSSSAFDRTPVLLSSPPLFFSFLLFSPCALHNPPFSLSPC